MSDLTVKQLAALSGVTVRTLHHYDEIGLLKPAHVGANGYRYYGRNERLRLQQILFHREFGAPLSEIGELLELEEGDRIGVLRRHRERLAVERERYRELIRTIDRTIAGLTQEDTMSTADLYKGFSAEKQAEYEAWLIERFGGDLAERVDASREAYGRLDEDGRKAVMTELAELEGAVAEAMRHDLPADSVVLQPVIARHRAWVARMWDKPCPPEAYAGLADLYTEHADFRARYETIETGLTEYLAAAMKAHAARA
jgi:DNA-binding transcriptional MerR regulator